MTFHLLRVHLSDIAQDSLPSLSSPFTLPDPDYNLLLTHDSRFRTFHKSLPPFFQPTHKPPPHPPFLWQKLLINIIYNTLLLRLHSPFLIRASLEPRFAYSRISIIRSSHALISLYRTLHTDPTLPPAPKTLAGVQGAVEGD